jgi:hypothetical protein
MPFSGGLGQAAEPGTGPGERRRATGAQAVRRLPLPVRVRAAARAQAIDGAGLPQRNRGRQRGFSGKDMSLASATAKVAAAAAVGLATREQGILDNVLKAVAAAEVLRALRGPAMFQRMLISLADVDCALRTCREAVNQVLCSGRHRDPPAFPRPMEM